MQLNPRADRNARTATQGDASNNYTIVTVHRVHTKLLIKIVVRSIGNVDVSGSQQSRTRLTPHRHSAPRPRCKSKCEMRPNQDPMCISIISKYQIRIQYATYGHLCSLSPKTVRRQRTQYSNRCNCKRSVQASSSSCKLQPRINHKNLWMQDQKQNHPDPLSHSRVACQAAGCRLRLL